MSEFRSRDGLRTEAWSPPAVTGLESEETVKETKDKGPDK